MKSAVSILGAGSWGTALAIHLAKKGIEVRLWVLEPEVCESIRLHRENPRYLPGIFIPEGVLPTLSQEEAIHNGDMTVLAVPSQWIRTVAGRISPFIRPGSILVNVAKGLEVNSLMRLSQVIEQEIPHASVAVLSGPSHAEEVAKDIPTALVSASVSREVAEAVQDTFIGARLRVYTHTDVIGVETGGAFKNIIALAAGICDGLQFGDNTKAALMTRGIVEMTRLGEAMGACTQTFSGLTGVGDLIVTCTSMHSRNRRAGILIGQGKSLEETLHHIKMVVEGVNTCDAAFRLARTLNVNMPITSELYAVLFQGKDPKEAVSDLMLRSRTHEAEEYHIIS